MDRIYAGRIMRHPRAPVGAVLLGAGWVYAFWPPPPADRGLWILAWAGFVGVTYAVASVGRRPALRDDSTPGTEGVADPEAMSMSPGHAETWRAEVAHDVRTPLMRMRLTLDDLARSGETGAFFASRLEGEVLRLEHLAEDLVDLGARAEAMWPAVLDLREVLVECLERAAPVFEAAGHPLLWEIDPVSPVRADRRHVERCLDNLLGNALRHVAGPGDIRVTLGMDGPLWVRVAFSNPSAPPMVPLTEWTKPFVRTDPSEGQPGFGLGLSVASRLAWAQGGRISLGYARGRVDASLLLPRWHVDADQPSEGAAPLDARPATP